tara:strand:+ start:29135 stop:31861 length:2727 start_codon:yes stop_codon:yes gene_type:complete
MKLKQLFIMVFMVLSFGMYSQGTINGTITDNEMSTPLSGANVVETGTNNGVISNFDGNFTLTVGDNTGSVSISYLGYLDQTISYTLVNGKADLGSILLMLNANELEEVVITGIVDFAKDRETPVATSTIRSEEIIEKLGSQEFPEILRSTPSVYVTKQGGGFGDSRINIRGFDQRNTAVMINGVPVNDMENGWVYWSNWAGLSDVTSAIQVQRGLGSSKLAISSVGGTINVLTNSADKKQGGRWATGFGNDNYFKNVLSYNTGKMDNGFSASVLFSRTTGDGYIDGTKFEGHNYYMAFGYQPNDKHNFQLTFTGAPQWHHQNSRAVSIGTNTGFNDGAINRKYNENWGYLNGEEYSYRRNFYHKPVMSLNWDWNLNEKSTVSSVFYGSWGRGGGSGPIGRINGSSDFSSKFKDSNGQIRFDDIVAWNSGNSVSDFGDDRVADDNGNFINSRSNGFSRRASMNSHDWYGTVINFNHELDDKLSFDFGADLRSYKGYHFRVVNDDLGADAYFDNRDDFNPDRIITPNQYESVSPSWNPWAGINDMEKIEYYNEGLVRWAGLFGQMEYKTDELSAFVQFSTSNQGFQRVEKFNDYGANGQTTAWENIIGGNIKGGANWNIDDNHNLFGNAGYYSKQPLFDAVFINFGNDLNPNLTNEKVLGTELGYGYRSSKLRANVNLYRTSWDDRYISVGSEFDTTGDGSNDTRGTANLTGVQQVHMGVEVDANYKVSEMLSLQGMVSFGDWKYNGDVTANYVDEDQNVILGGDGSAFQEVLYLDDVKVGNAAQFTARLGATVKLNDHFKADAGVYWADNLYASIDPTDFNSMDHKGSLELPSYSLTDFGLSYTTNFGKKMSLDIRLNVNNVFDTLYISESQTNRHAEAGDATWEGVNTDNRVYWGFGRTWNTSIALNF